MLSADWGSWRACLVWGLATLAVSRAFGLFMPEALAHPIAGSPITNPVLAFEFSRTPAHLAAVFGEMGDPLRPARIAGMIDGNLFDYLFMVVYGSFVLAFFGASANALGDRRWWLAGALGPFAALADAVENALLLSINADMTTPEAELEWLAFPVWTKFTALALACGVAAGALIRMRGWPAAVLCLPAPAAIGFGLAQPLRWGEPAVSAIALAWIGMLGWSGWRTWRGARGRLVT